MFETAELGRKVSKADYEAAVPELRMKLLEIQTELKNARFPVLVIIGGVDGAGKGETVNLLNEWMDPRFLMTHAFGAPSEEEIERPPFWRFWRAMPQKGRVGIFFGSWYTSPIVRHVYSEIDEPAFLQEARHINAMEKMLADDGALIVKFWFHLGKNAQEKRLKSLEKKEETRWRVTPTDWKHFAMYDRFKDVSGRMLAATSTPEAPWLVVEGEDARYRSLTVGQTLLELITERINSRKAGAPVPATPVATRPPETTRGTTVLDKLDLTQAVDGSKYRKELERLQGKLNIVYRKAKEKGISTVLLFEGWDSAGKGGLIRRMTPALDARDYRIIPIAAPSDEERAQHYLWRFWRHLPGKGRIAIYDRSWYGRVLVERVEGFAKPHEWSRAYAEINEFERQLTANGIVLLKFWLHIDKDEQLRRFKEREDTPFKRFKITEEDWRNREKWDDYEIAVNEMVERTATLYAPWHLLEGNDKKFARIKALRILHDALKKAVKGD